MNIAVFASHGGSDLQAIIDGCKSNKIVIIAGRSKRWNTKCC